MRAEKRGDNYYQLRFSNKDNTFFLDGASEAGRRKGQFYIANGIDIKKNDWKKYKIYDFIQSLFDYKRNEEDRWEEIIEAQTKNYDEFEEKMDEVDNNIKYEIHLRIEKFLNENNIKWKK